MVMATSSGLMRSAMLYWNLSSSTSSICVFLASPYLFLISVSWFFIMLSIFCGESSTFFSPVIFSLSSASSSLRDCCSRVDSF